MTLDKHHVTLYVVAIALTLGLALSTTYFIESRIADRNQQKYEVLKAQSDLLTQQNTQFQQQAAQTITQLQETSKQLAATSTQQQATITSLKQQLQDQRGKDASLPPTDLANRIQVLAPGGSITAVADGYHLDQAEAVSVAQALEEPPILRQEITADEIIIGNDTAIIANDAKVLSTEQQSHQSDVKTLQSKLDADDQEVKTVKAQARKGKLKWFGIGYVAGFASHAILKSFVVNWPL
jgi:uncharacterized protein HemX